MYSRSLLLPLFAAAFCHAWDSNPWVSSSTTPYYAQSTSSSPATIYVEVGPNGTFTYNPNNVKAKKGDKLVFKFNPKNHTVTQSSFDYPCESLEKSSYGHEKGFDSGFMPVPANTASTAYRPEFTVEVKDDKTPIWVYCRQRINDTATHCGQGMVFAANAPSQGNTFDKFLQKAKSSDVSSSPYSSSNSPSTIYVEVGPNGTFTYSPNNVQAKKGDKLVFKFNPKNHTVTQSSFDYPCESLEKSSYGHEKGFDSGFMPVSANTTSTAYRPEFTVEVKDDKTPIWVYCRQRINDTATHCGQGMVFAANAPSQGNTFDKFLQKAKSSDSSSSPYSSSNSPSTIYVEVGPNGTFTYNPNNVQAKKGDKLVFKFNPKNHTVTQSSFDYPCESLEKSSYGHEKGFDSGFMPVSANTTSTAYRPEFTVEVKDDKTPIWVYCRQRINDTATHCGQGMVFAANAPSQGNTFDKFLQKAKSSDASSSPYSSSNSPSTIYVEVGPNGTFTYEPNNVQAKKGDKLVFKFNPKNHTVTQSSFDYPCEKLETSSYHYETGFDSGFMPVPANTTSTAYRPEFTVEVKDDKTPIWVYCQQRINDTATHCGQGMVFAANAPSQGNTFDKFLQKAKSSDASSNTSSSSNSPSTIHVQVGPNGTFTYEPNNFKAKKGDKVVFHFNPKNHTVTQSSFNDPCVKLETSSHGYERGFDSGFMPVNETSGDVTFNITIEDDTKPIWAYCRQTGHCVSGMVLGINAPDDGPRSFWAFQQLAEHSNSTTLSASYATSTAKPTSASRY